MRDLLNKLDRILLRETTLKNRPVPENPASRQAMFDYLRRHVQEADVSGGYGYSIAPGKKPEIQQKSPKPSWRLNRDGTATDMNSGITYYRDGSVKNDVEEDSLNEQGVAEGLLESKTYTYGIDNPYEVKPWENFDVVFRPGRNSGVHRALMRGQVSDPFHFRLNGKVYSVSGKGDGMPRDVSAGNTDLGPDVPMPRLSDYSRSAAKSSDNDPDVALAKAFAKKQGYDPEDMDEIQPVVDAIKTNPRYRAEIASVVRQGVAEAWRDYDYDNDRKGIPSNATFVNLEPELYVHYENGKSQALTRSDPDLVEKIIGDSDYDRFFLDSDMERYLRERKVNDEDIDQFQSEFSVQQNLQKGYWEARLANKVMSKTEDIFQIGDEFGISLSEDFEVGTEIVDILDDGVVIELDDRSIEYFIQQGFTFESQESLEKVKVGEKVSFNHALKSAPGHSVKKTGKVVQIDGDSVHVKVKDRYGVLTHVVKISDITNESIKVDEAEYQGRKVPLGKPMKGDVKKSKVYVKNPQGNVVKVNFGDKQMRIKKSNPARRKSFRARHNCANPGPRHKARYWSCRAW